MEFEFVGECSGDGECFCWKVSEETFARVKGEEEYEQELHFRKIEMEALDQMIKEGDIAPEAIDMVKDSLTEWYLYPDDVFSDSAVRFKVESFEE